MSTIRDIDIHGATLLKGTENEQENMIKQQDAMKFATPMNQSGRDYRHLFPKKFCLILSFVQLVCSCIVIITEVIMQPENFVISIFIGIFFGLSGGIGIVASLTQREPIIKANMIMSIITIVLAPVSLTLFGSGNEQLTMDRDKAYSLSQLRLAICVIQILASSWSFGISCQAIFNCCKDAKTLEKYKSFPKTAMKVLSSIQLVIAILVIITGAISMYLLSYGGFWNMCILWCVFFGVCGITGIIASFDPTTLKITMLVVFDLITALVSLPLMFYLLLILGFSLTYERGSSSGWTLMDVLGVTSTTFIGIEWIITICSLVIACISICTCCEQNKEPCNIELANVYHDNIRGGGNIQSNFGTPSGYRSVPMSRMENVPYSNDSKNIIPFSTNEVPSESFAPTAPMIDDNSIPAYQDPFL